MVRPMFTHWTACPNIVREGMRLLCSKIFIRKFETITTARSLPHVTTGRCCRSGYWRRLHWRVTIGHLQWSLQVALQTNSAVMAYGPYDMVNLQFNLQTIRGHLEISPARLLFTSAKGIRRSNARSFRNSVSENSSRLSKIIRTHSEAFHLFDSIGQERHGRSTALKPLIEQDRSGGSESELANRLRIRTSESELIEPL